MLWIGHGLAGGCLLESEHCADVASLDGLDFFAVVGVELLV